MSVQRSSRVGILVAPATENNTGMIACAENTTTHHAISLAGSDVGTGSDSGFEFEFLGTSNSS